MTNKNLKKLVLQVYNRWGEKVFESTGPKDGWDGFYKNSEQAIGTYVWRAEYQTTTMKKAKFENGNVTLIR
jgi:gliding motility-associated-like protein